MNVLQPNTFFILLSDLEVWDDEKLAIECIHYDGYCDY